MSAAPAVRATLRDGLLDGRCVALAGVPASTLPARLAKLGARLELLSEPLLADEAAATAWAGERAPLRAMVYDAAGAFGQGGPDALTRTLDGAWRAARAVATGAMMESPQPGRLLFVAPAPDAGPHAAAARAALENLARTLSVEWARFAVTTVAVTPGPATASREVAELVAFLISDAGAYFSGCRFDLGSVAVRPS